MILECRIIVCHYSVEPIIQKSQTSTLNILSSNRFTFFTSLAERLPGWFALLAQFGNVKNKQATVVLLQYPFTNLRIVYLMHILIAGRMQTLCPVSNVIASIRKEKIGSKRSASECPFDRGMGEGVKSYLGIAR